MLAKIKSSLFKFNWFSFFQRFLVFLAIIYISSYILLAGLLRNTDVEIFFETQQLIYRLLYWTSVFILCIYLSKIWTKLTIIKILFTYLVYNLLSYFLLITRNINNSNFNIHDFNGNDFWQINAFEPLTAIVGGAFIFKIIFNYIKLPYVTKVLDSDKPRISIIHWLPTLFVVTDNRVVEILKDNVSTYLTTEEFINILQYVLPTLLLIQLATGVLVALFFRAVRGLLINRSSFSLAIITSSVIALVLNYYLQLGVAEQELFLERSIFPGATIYQFAFLTFFALLIYILTNRYILGTILIITLSISLVIANTLKFSMRNEPLLITDVTWLSNPTLLFEFVNDDNLIIVLICIVLLIGLAVLFRNLILPNKIFETYARRLMITGGLIGIAIFTAEVFRSEENHKVVDGIPILSKIANWQDTDWLGFSINARYKSLAYVWTKQLTNEIMEKPESYSKKAIEDLVKKYKVRAQQINQTRTRNISEQTVIYILSESLSNPRNLEGISVSKNILENIEIISSETTSGMMRADSYGGGTANMEFQALTSLPYYNFSESVSVLMTEVFPKMKVIPSISDEFEKTGRIIIHPLDARNYNRNSFYEALGFGKQIFLTGSKYKLENIDIYGNSVSDATTYSNILNNIDISKSQFFSIITMQNHAPWIVEKPENITADSSLLDESSLKNLNSYVKMVDKTDQETKKFLDALKEIDKEITVVFYGDHLPGLYPNTFFQNNPESQYQTNYFVWSNYETKKLDYPLVNSSDFTALLLAHTNSKVTPYQALLTDVLNNASVDKDNLSEEQEIIADDLRLVQYDMSLGKSYLNDRKDFIER